MGSPARLWAPIALPFLVFFVGAATAATPIDGLYQGMTPVTGDGPENRGPAIARCLEDVLVKVSGDPSLIGDPTVAALGEEASRYVAGLSYHDRMEGIPHHDEQGSRDRPYDLTVSFVPEAIDAALRDLGRTPWTAPRPSIVAIIGVNNGPTSFALNSDGGRPEMREALETAAWTLGLPMRVPGKVILDGDGIRTATDVAAADMAVLDAVAKAEGGDLTLAGNLAWSDTDLGWVADWRLSTAGTTYRWRVKGVSFDKAFRGGMTGAAQILSGHGQPG
jgi:hypothetical protein